ncbi:uncharacterized protein LOC111625069 [Centruroides sculpturatus]|uniref:uncharacterized protein LOC111625069 n=1 Tax=Centruroides sculpturatus TaxID=218467 RepID=UPI000C6D7CC9|nr:uncharacterized protein LOC111625069 [Centruroides sculpturatus]
MPPYSRNRNSPVLAATYYFNTPNDSNFDDKLENNLILSIGETCVAADGQKGSCYDTSECVRRRGTPIGQCKNQNLVCCIFQISCGDVIRQSPVYVRNPGYPQSHNKEKICKIRIEKVNSTICQFKLEYIDFDIARPVDGNCTNDVLIITGHDENNRIPRICGLNNGQHIYVDVRESGELGLHIMMIGNNSRKFNILITQIYCYGDDLAPSHCLQYYTESQGEIKSFNYEEHTAPMRMQGYPNNLDYAICLKKMPGYCSVTYQLSTGRNGGHYPFAVGTAASSALSSSPVTAECKDDYLVIRDTRLCSAAMAPSPTRTLRNVNASSPILLTDTTSGPFIVRFVSNGARNARGFSLKYQQHPCNNQNN